MGEGGGGKVLDLLHLFLGARPLLVDICFVFIYLSRLSSVSFAVSLSLFASFVTPSVPARASVCLSVALSLSVSVPLFSLLSLFLSQPVCLSVAPCLCVFSTRRLIRTLFTLTCTYHPQHCQPFLAFPGPFAGRLIFRLHLLSQSSDLTFVHATLIWFETGAACVQVLGNYTDRLQQPVRYHHFSTFTGSTSSMLLVK